MHTQKQNRRSRLPFIKGCGRLFQVLPLVVVLLLVSGIGASAQTVIKGWTVGGESDKNIDVSYSIVKCTPTSDAELLLEIFNEKPTADVAKFDVEITDVASSQSFTTSVNRSMALAEMVIGECGTTSSNLRITLPSSYNPAAVTVKITFTP